MEKGTNRLMPIKPRGTRALACYECDALMWAPRDQVATFRCPRCAAVVHRSVPKRLDHALALYLAACIFFALANAYPIIAVQTAKGTVDATLLGAVRALHAENMDIVAVIVTATTVIAPILELLCTTLLLILAKIKHSSPALAALFRLREALLPWSMVEIFVLGTLVAIVKLGDLGSVLLGAGVWSMGVFIILSAAASHAFDPLELWSEIGARS